MLHFITELPQFQISLNDANLLSLSTGDSLTLYAQYANVTAKPLYGSGTLYVANEKLIFFSAENRGFTVEYPHMGIHAIDMTNKGVYCQIDTEEEKEKEEEGEGEGVLEVFFIPMNEDYIMQIFNAISKCAAMHPDYVSDPGDAVIANHYDDGQFEDAT